jgi:transcriptional regulator with XRE-family HTH domain
MKTPSKRKQEGKSLSPKKSSPEYDLGERLRYLREQRGLTQKQLAANAHVSQATIAHIEMSSKDPSVETLRKLAEALDIHVATLFSTNEVYVFDLKRLRRKYNHADKLTPHLYMGLGRVVQYARDIGFIK